MYDRGLRTVFYDSDYGYSLDRLPINTGRRTGSCAKVSRGAIKVKSRHERSFVKLFKVSDTSLFMDIFRTVSLVNFYFIDVGKKSVLNSSY